MAISPAKSLQKFLTLEKGRRLGQKQHCRYTQTKKRLTLIKITGPLEEWNEDFHWSARHVTGHGPAGMLTLLSEACVCCVCECACMRACLCVHACACVCLCVRVYLCMCARV